MDKIASPTELVAALEGLLAYASSHNPSRNLIASELGRLAERVAARMPAMPRDFYIPSEVRNRPPVTPEGTDLAIWTWETNNVPYGIAFQGKANKPLWHYRFRTEAERQRRINETVESRKKSLALKSERLEERRSFKHSLKEGDILYSSWGYDQTNVDFYQVVGVGEASVKIREIAQKAVESSNFTDSVVAVPDRFVGDVMTKRVSPGNYVRFTSYKSARPWDGKPKYQTSFGAGH